MTESVDNQVLEVRRDTWGDTRIVSTQESTDVGPGHALLRVNRLALTANNISYAASGDALGYWKFFPAADEGWGRIPAMGYAEVIASKADGVEVGEKVWGFFPYGRYLNIQVGKVNDFAFADVSPHRDGLAPLYARFDRASVNPIYEQAREDQDLLLRGLFLTSWLVEDFMDESDCYGASAYLITSASSKTSIALAYRVKQRGKQQSIGLTSKGNIAFCESLGCYDKVIAYEDIETLDSTQPAVTVDMAGNGDVLKRIHVHYNDQLKYSCKIGATHYDKMDMDAQDLPGARPEFFFAPGHAKKRTDEWGPGVMEMRIMEDFKGFREFADSWLKVSHGCGPEQATDWYLKVLQGGVAPETGVILTFHDSLR